MTKTNLMRWVLDLGVIVTLGFAGWSFKEFAKLNESDIIHRTKIEAVSSSVDRLDETLHALTESLDRQNDQLRSLVMLATFRTDPWSGRMMGKLQEDWFDLLSPVIPDLKLSDLPDVIHIQEIYRDELAPEALR